jgi:hypothetical protein
MAKLQLYAPKSLGPLNILTQLPLTIWVRLEALRSRK